MHYLDPKLNLLFSIVWIQLVNSPRTSKAIVLELCLVDKLAQVYIFCFLNYEQILCNQV